MENVELLERLGAGSFGRVYKYRCVGSQQMSALLRFAFGSFGGPLGGVLGASGGPLGGLLGASWGVLGAANQHDGRR